jgi:Protein kinase domain
MIGQGAFGMVRYSSIVLESREREGRTLYFFPLSLTRHYILACVFQVYKGRKEDTGETVAIKRIPFCDSSPEGGVPCNVIREISLLKELDHTNVVRFHSIVRSPG